MGRWITRSVSIAEEISKPNRLVDMIKALPWVEGVGVNKQGLINFWSAAHRALIVFTLPYAAESQSLYRNHVSKRHALVLKHDNNM